MKALIFAAGKGTRLKPFTDSHPKALATVNGVALLERNIKYLQSFGINDFVINVHHFGEQIIDFLNVNQNFGANITISNEKDELLETGGGLLFAREYLENEKDFLIMNADILTDLNINEFLQYHQHRNELVSLAVSDRKSSRKLLFDNNYHLKGWRNLVSGEERRAESDKDFEALAFSGIHIVRGEFIKLMKRTGKFSIMDEYLDLMKTININGFKHQAKLIDVGKPEAIQEAEKLFL